MRATMQRPLLMIAAVLECLAGVALLLVPRMTIVLLLGVEPHGDGLMIGRVGGIALLSLGIACWRSRAEPGGAARTGTLHAIALYNAGAGVLFVVFAATGQAGGPVTWAAGILHLGLGAAFTASLTPTIASGNFKT
jgi:hypothetical protein